MAAEPEPGRPWVVLYGSEGDGRFLLSCPDYLRVSPACAQAAEAAWWLMDGRGGMGQRYADPPLALVRAAQAYAAGYCRGAADRMRARMAERA